jgi:hypothetical protein
MMQVKPTSPTENTGTPEPLVRSPPLKGQENFLYSYVIFKKPMGGLLGYFKLISVHPDKKSCLADYKRAIATNKGRSLKWHETGEWIPIRDPLTDTQGTVDIIKEDDDDFFGESLTEERKRLANKNDAENGGVQVAQPPLLKETLKQNEETAQIEERAIKDEFKDSVKERMQEEKKLKQRQEALAEIDEELADKESLTYYAQQHWKRLTMKSAITEYKNKVEQAQKALYRLILELKEIERKHPQYTKQWEDQIRKIQRLTKPNQADDNPVDKPIANLGREDDEALAGAKMDEVKDDFDKGTGVEAKTQLPGQAEVYRFDKGKEEEDQLEKDHIQKIQADLKRQEEELERKKKEVAESFLEGAAIEGKKKSKKDKKSKKKKLVPLKPTDKKAKKK